MKNQDKNILDYVWILISVKNRVKMIETDEKLGQNNNFEVMITYNRISENIFQNHFGKCFPK